MAPYQACLTAPIISFYIEMLFFIFIFIFFLVLTRLLFSDAARWSITLYALLLLANRRFPDRRRVICQGYLASASPQSIFPPQ